MRKSLVALAVISLALFSSCDKCKDADCKNAATCEKKVGDCNCEYFYEGSKCEAEIRAGYVGKYIGTTTVVVDFLGQSITDISPDTIEIITNGSNVNSLGFKDDADMSLVLTSNTTFTAKYADLDSTGISFEAGGTFSSTTLTLDVTETGNIDGGLYKGSAKFTGKKQ